MRAMTAATWTDHRCQQLQTLQLRCSLTPLAVMPRWRTAEGHGLPERALLSILGYAMPAHNPIELPPNLRLALRRSTTSWRYAPICLDRERAEFPRMQNCMTSAAAMQPPLRIQLLKIGELLLRGTGVSDNFLTCLSGEAHGIGLAESRRINEAVEDEAEDGAEAEEQASAEERADSEEADEEEQE
jgi:hypothetical protein